MHTIFNFEELQAELSLLNLARNNINLKGAKFLVKKQKTETNEVWKDLFWIIVNNWSSLPGHSPCAAFPRKIKIILFVIYFVQRDDSLLKPSLPTLFGKSSAFMPFVKSTEVEQLKKAFGGSLLDSPLLKDNLYKPKGTLSAMWVQSSEHSSR